ncbi:MAG: Hsp20/alpha crystallin family protein [archaeon]
MRLSLTQPNTANEVNKMMWNGWNPFEEMARMQHEMDRMLSWSDGSRPLLAPRAGNHVVPRRAASCDLCDTENSLIAAIELPGVNKEDIGLNVTDSNIEITVNRKHEKEKKAKGGYSYVAENRHFYRNIPLPHEVNADKAVATYTNGLLRIELPKVKRDKAKKIKIQ